MSLILLSLGGGIGALMRYILSKIIKEHSYFSIPISTMLINIIGSFFLGVSVFAIRDNNLAAFIQTGILGGFTTFSTFLVESFELLKEDGFPSMLKYMLPTTILGVIFFIIGARMFY
ncbi:camphor resistance protein CrcB [Peptostreptococcus russellii]|uniref:Fluoride-specific ion channel FluC n=1 Tax=Peptostreptococcus russellii TaxID=215200 RepID=A0A1H8FMV5_9FIRM|nr:fluoride efflux transporter CrcB [Peptostreptococcus russellii]SEN33006.1 camphor resistance protein CrcB [Peptostreptococcus russellii]